MTGGMRIDPKELPLRHQEQVAAAILAQFAQTPPVAVREETSVRNRLPVRKLAFVNAQAAWRYLVLRKQIKFGMVRDLVMMQNERGVITNFIYSVEEVY